MNELFLTSLLFENLDRDRGRRELGVIEGIAIVGTKAFKRLCQEAFLYGTFVYEVDDLPMAASVDMDQENLQPLCSALEWHLTYSVSDKKEETKDTTPNLCATLITNAAECSDVEWS